MNLEVLREELKKVSDIAPNGSHKDVAKKVGISIMYLWQIRSNKNAKVDNEENRKLTQSIIKEYRKLIRKAQAKYQSI